MCGRNERSMWIDLVNERISVRQTSVPLPQTPVIDCAKLAHEALVFCEDTRMCAPKHL